MVMDLIFLYKRILPKLLFMDFQNILFIVMVFNIALLLTKEFMSQSEKWDSESIDIN